VERWVNTGRLAIAQTFQRFQKPGSVYRDKVSVLD